MKKLAVIPIVALLISPVWAGNYESVWHSDSNDAEMIEAQEAEDSIYESQHDHLDHEELYQERMEDDVIDYSDRTRTQRARNAINTGSDASDDQ